MRTSAVLAGVAALLPLSDAFAPTPALRCGLSGASAAASSSLRTSPLSALSMQAQDNTAAALPRRAAITQAAALAAATWFGAAGSAQAKAAQGPAVGTAETTEEGVEYKVLKQGKGPNPRIGDLVAIRFSAALNGKEFDNTFKTPNSYYYRVGSESVIKGLDIAVQKMRVGDKWELVIPAPLAFGEKGVKPSPGKPKIPGGASIEYTVLLETFPGAEDEILDLNGEQE